MPVLGTKLHVPAPRRRLVARDRLLDRLDGSSMSRPRLVLLSAPAGFGKTTLLAQWLASSDDSARRGAQDSDGRGVAWLSLDAADRDLRQFLTDLVAAVQTSLPKSGAEAMALMDTDRGLVVAEVLASLVNDLDVYAGPLVIALDDYHVIDDPAVHEAVTFLLDHLPPSVTVAMTTRADPPLPLSRLRARGELLEVRVADLRFTLEEAELFLNQVMGLGLGADLVRALEARTEGWAAGLQLAALSVDGRTGPEGPGGRADIEQFVTAFSGSNRFVLDYLVEEVLATQPAPVRTFLLDTSVLTRLSGPLCDAVTGLGGGQLLLERLERSNLFVVPLDDDRHWFRYHHLFADALRARLLAEGSDRLPRLHRAASEWHAANGDLAEAIDHARAAGDVDHAADLVELALPAARKHRQNHLLHAWLRALPDEVLSSRPLLATHMAWVRLADGDVDGVAAWLDAAEAGFTASATAGRGLASPLDAARAREDELRSLPAVIEVYRAAVAQARGDVDGTVTHARQALDLAAPDDHYPRAGAAGFAGMAAWAAGDLDTAVETFEQTVTSLHAAGMVADELGATVVLGAMWLARGRPLEARRLYEAALAAAESDAGPVLPTLGDLHVGLAAVLVEQSELGGAASHLEVARTLGNRASLLENRHRWFTTMASLQAARGDLDAAAELLDQAAPLYLPGFYPDIRPVAAAKARVLITQGKLDEAAEWARDHHVADDDAGTYVSEFDQLTLARLLLARHHAGDTGALNSALALLERSVASAEAAGREGSIIETRWLRALAHHAGADPKPALDDLTRALTSGVPAGYRRLFLDEGTPAVALLSAVAGQQHSPVASDAAILLATLDACSGDATATAARRRGGSEQLSEREVDVLRLLATDLTGPEISSQLFMSINTFRTHSRHIFTKLGVSTRRAAVRRAGELDLL